MFVFGQDKAILAPIDRSSLSHVAMPLGATAGDLWAVAAAGQGGRDAQDGEHRHPAARRQFLRPTFGDSRLETPPTVGTSVDIGTSSGLGERSTQAVLRGARRGHAQDSRFGVDVRHLGASFWRERRKSGSSIATIRSWAVAFDGSAMVDPHIVVARRGVYREATSSVSGRHRPRCRRPGRDGVPARRAENSAHRRAGEGWGELTVFPTASGKNAFYVGAGTDKPKLSTLLPGSGRAENTFIWASYFRKLNSAVTLGAEWSNWRFKTETFVDNAPSSVSARKASQRDERLVRLSVLGQPRGASPIRNWWCAASLLYVPMPTEK